MNVATCVHVCVGGGGDVWEVCMYSMCIYSTRYMCVHRHMYPWVCVCMNIHVRTRMHVCGYIYIPAVVNYIESKVDSTRSLCLKSILTQVCSLQ